MNITARELVRGGLGRDSDGFMDASQQLVVLDGAVQRIAIGASGVGWPFNRRDGRDTRDLSDASCRQTNDAFAGIGRRPYARSPQGPGNLTDLRIRRTRRDGDDWNQAEVLLGEVSEVYEVHILDGATVARTLATAVSQVVCGAGSQVADFGAPQAAIACRVHQLSASRRVAPSAPLLASGLERRSRASAFLEVRPRLAEPRRSDRG